MLSSPSAFEVLSPSLPPCCPSLCPAPASLSPPACPLSGSHRSARYRSHQSPLGCEALSWGRTRPAHVRALPVAGGAATDARPAHSRERACPWEGTSLFPARLGCGGGPSRVLVPLRGGRQARVSRSSRSAWPRPGPFGESCCLRDLTRGRAASAVRTRDRPAGAGQAKPHWGPEPRGLRRGWFPVGSAAAGCRAAWQSRRGAGGDGAAPASAAPVLSLGERLPSPGRQVPDQWCGEGPPHRCQHRFPGAACRGLGRRTVTASQAGGRKAWEG